MKITKPVLKTLGDQSHPHFASMVRLLLANETERSISHAVLVQPSDRRFARRGGMALLKKLTYLFLPFAIISSKTDLIAITVGYFL
jgi:hypothetical protein